MVPNLDLIAIMRIVWHKKYMVLVYTSIGIVEQCTSFLHLLKIIVRHATISEPNPHIKKCDRG